MWSAGKSILLCSWICVLSACATVFQLTSVQVAVPSIIRISATFDEGSGTCTAFSVNESPGRWITAGHCAKGDVKVGSLVFRPLAFDAEHDVALLETPHGLPPLLIGDEPRFGDRTTALGYPLTSEQIVAVPSVYQGHFKMWKDDPIPFAIFIGNSMPGMSGGPILDQSGRVVSVILGGGNPARDYQSVGFGVPYPALRKMVGKGRVTTASSSETFRYSQAR